MKLEIFNPFSGRMLQELSLTPAPAVEDALAHAHALHRSAAHLPIWRRLEILDRAASRIEMERLALARQIAAEGGKPLKDALAEVDRAIHSTRLAGQVLASERGDEIPMGLSPAGEGRLAYTRRMPIGPVVSVSAFNHPLNLIAHQVAPAVAADCPVIVKPSLQTPLSCLDYVRILREAGLPEERCQVVLCANDVTERLVTDPRVAFFSFIGSAKVGWYLRGKLAPGARCALEHGGVAPVVVADDADLDPAAAAITKGGYYHAGQVCVSVQRVFAVGPTADRLAERLAGMVGALVYGDPLSEETDVGPLIAAREVERVASWVDEAVDGGASVLAGGERASERVYKPTLLMDPPSDCALARREVFGPVVSLFRCRDLAEAVVRANDVDAAFHAAVFTRDLDLALDIADALSASAVMVNDHTAFRVDWMPFSGLGTSGLGTGGIAGSYDEMTYEKMTVIRRGASCLSARNRYEMQEGKAR